VFIIFDSKLDLRALFDREQWIFDAGEAARLWTRHPYAARTMPYDRIRSQWRVMCEPDFSVEPDPTEMAARYGTGTRVLDCATERRWRATPA
jgi:hypothetical protein